MIPAKVVAAAGDRRSGATEIAMVAAEGLLEVADQPEALAAAVDLLLVGQPAMAPVWHLARAAHAAEPGAALRQLLGSLERDTDAAVLAARSWLDREVGRGAPVATVSHSSLVDRVLAGRVTERRDPRGRGVSAAGAGAAGSAAAASGATGAGGVGAPAADAGGGAAGGAAAAGLAAAGVMGADAIGPAALLNADGSAALAARLPTLVVATAVKLVPEPVFDGLAAPGFERVPLAAVAAVVLGGAVVEPAEAGRRAAALGGPA